MVDAAKGKTVEVDEIVEAMEAAKNKHLGALKKEEEELEEQIREWTLRLTHVRTQIAKADAAIARRFGFKTQAPRPVKNGVTKVKAKGVRRTAEQVQQDSEAMAAKIVGALRSLKAKDKDSAVLVTKISGEISGHPPTEALAPGIEIATKHHDVKHHGVRRGRRYYLA